MFFKMWKCTDFKNICTKIKLIKKDLFFIDKTELQEREGGKEEERENFLSASS